MLAPGIDSYDDRGIRIIPESYSNDHSELISSCFDSLNAKAMTSSPPSSLPLKFPPVGTWEDRLPSRDRASRPACIASVLSLQEKKKKKKRSLGLGGNEETQSQRRPEGNKIREQNNKDRISRRELARSFSWYSSFTQSPHLLSSFFLSSLRPVMPTICHRTRPWTERLGPRSSPWHYLTLGFRADGLLGRLSVSPQNLDFCPLN